jgi:hypothetical protein
MASVAARSRSIADRMRSPEDSPACSFLFTKSIQPSMAVPTSDRGWLTQWRDERDRLVRVSKTAIDAGVDVRRVELEQARVSMQAAAVRAAMDAVGMGEEDRVVFVRAMIGQLRVAGEQ